VKNEGGMHVQGREKMKDLEFIRGDCQLYGFI